MFRSRLQSSSREDVVSEVFAMIGGLVLCSIFYGFIGEMVRAYLALPYQAIDTTFVVFSQFAQNVLLGITFALGIGCILAVWFVVALVHDLLTHRKTAYPA